MTNLLPITKAYLELVNKQPSLATMTAQEGRQLRAIPKPAIQECLASIKDSSFFARDGASIPVRIYTPHGEGPFPVIVYYHGGGWVINNINTCHKSCAALCASTQSVVVSVDYRLAPEYKFPVPVEDAHDALQWVQQNIQILNGIATKISVAGDSAGANLATVLTQLNEKIAAQILLYPVTDLSFNTQSYKKYTRYFGLDQDVMKWFSKHYIRNEIDSENPLVAPLLAKIEKAPPTFIVVAEHDVLRDEGVAYAEKLRKTGAQVELQTADGLVHSFFTKNDVFAVQITETIEQIKRFLTAKVYKL